MKVLFTADIHYKLGQKHVPVEWAKNRYKLFQDQLVDVCAQADLLIIGGDIWDKYPSADELELYFNLVKVIPIKTFVYSGNHESTTKHGTFFTNFKDVTNWINPLVEVIDEYYSYENIDFIPYNKLKHYEKDGHKFSGTVLCTHVRGEIPPHVKPEVDLSIFDKWQVVLAGDLHSYENSQRNILYPGSPLTTSFHRHNVDTGIVLFDTDSMSHQHINLKLPQLIRKTIKAGEPMPPTEYDHTIYEIEGDMSELGALADSDLIDKKIIKRDSDTTLILAPDLTLEEEVNEYLRYVLQLSDSAVEDALQELNNYANELIKN